MKHLLFNTRYLFLYTAVLFGCFEEEKVTGTSSEEGNAIVAGRLVYEDGTPAAGAKVYIRPHNAIADTSGLGLGKIAADTATTTTDDSGYYAIDTGVIDTGTYVIEGDDGSSNLVLIDSVTVQDEDSTVQVPEDTLKPAGALKGFIYLSEGGDPRKVFILAFGINRFAQVESDGSFRFENLPEGQYDLQFISSLDDYGVLDTVGIPVISADTTDLDTLELPFTGIPTPKDLAAEYDTLSNRVTLTWRTDNPQQAAGYKVYRRQGTSGTYEPAVDTITTDTLFIDGLSNGLEKGLEYQYMVRALDADENEGLNSSPVSVVIAFYVDAGPDSTYELGDPVTLKGTINTAAITPAEYRWDADGDGTAELTSESEDSLVFTYTEKGNFSAVFTVKADNDAEFTDTVLITIISKDTAGAPSAPRGLELAYDTLRQIVTLTWLPNLETDVQGYNIYRKHSDSGFVKTNSALITDSTFSDSSAVQDETYEYKVTAVDGADNEGEKSESRSIIAESGFKLIDSFGAAGTLNGQFANPTGLTLSSDTTVLVVDVLNHRIQEFNFNGEFIQSVGTNGSGDDQFDVPMDIAVDANGNIFIADHENDRIQKYDSQFNFLGTVSANLNNPQSVAIDTKGNIYVNEISTPLIKKYDNDLNFLLEWGRGGNFPDGLGGAHNLAVDSLDRVYVVANSHVVIFDSIGNFIEGLETDSNGNDYFDNPINISINGNSIYITDIGLKQILKFNLSGDLIGKWGKKEYYSVVGLPNGEVWASVLVDQAIYRFSTE
ncbi:6-bladed beta-propeller [Fibrobacterota bacterium]